jgi:protein phosphatase
VRTALIALATVVVLGAAAVGGYLFVMRHWFVGVTDTTDGAQVAVYQGLDASILGIDLYRLDHATGLATSDLTQAARSRVGAGIDATDRTDAQRILANLRGQRLPLCRSAASPSSSAPPSTPAADATTTPVPPVDPAATVVPSAPPTPVSPTVTPTNPSSSGRPGVDCREGD